MKPLHAILLFAIGAILIAFLYPYEILLTLVVAIGCVAVLAIGRWGNLKHFVVAVIVGGICENIAVALGGWEYANASFLFTPLWLPLGWGITVVLIEDAFGKNAPAYFSWAAVFLAFLGTVCVALLAPDEGLTLFLFSAATVGLFAFRFYTPAEIKVGIGAAVLGSAMEILSIWSGNWDYSVATFGMPLWLPLCWFNAFLLMRRVMRAFD